MTDRLTHLDEKILHLKKKREKAQAQQALSFMKETQKIFKEEFSAGLALTVLTESWGSAPETKKESWKKRSQTFPSSSLQRDGKKDQPIQPTTHQS
ncbi:hypothetical protein QM565_01440 [Geitlerinema splendidum]|nr:hypothetical protein [Geitlerinema splendidum]